MVTKATTLVITQHYPSHPSCGLFIPPLRMCGRGDEVVPPPGLAVRLLLGDPMTPPPPMNELDVAVAADIVSLDVPFEA